jgi:hypothetical protein
MKRRVGLIALGGLGLAAIALALSGRAPLAVGVPPLVPALGRRPQAPGPFPPPSGAALDRNPFEYGDRRPVGSDAPSLGEAPSDPAAPQLSTLAPVRLVGFVRRAGTLRAVLVVAGELGLVEVGGALSGFTLLAADEESGVRLRDPGGSELVLPLEP